MPARVLSVTRSLRAKVGVLVRALRADKVKEMYLSFTLSGYSASDGIGSAARTMAILNNDHSHRLAPAAVHGASMPMPCWLLHLAGIRAQARDALVRLHYATRLPCYQESRIARILPYPSCPHCRQHGMVGLHDQLRHLVGAALKLLQPRQVKEDAWPGKVLRWTQHAVAAQRTPRGSSADMPSNGMRQWWALHGESTSDAPRVYQVNVPIGKAVDWIGMYRSYSKLSASQCWLHARYE